MALTDEQLVCAFESVTLAAPAFDQVAHVRVGWWYLRHYPLGAAIDRLLAMHPETAAAQRRADEAGLSLPSMLADLAAHSAGSPSAAIHLARGLHVVPEFLGNRAPFADPEGRAAIVRVDIVGTAASARIDTNDVSGLCFTDFFSLLKIDGKWIIVNKVYHTYPGA